jgi:hypothetical protein
MTTKLILIDGAPGLGKSTTVANLQKTLGELGDVRAVFCHEHDHPLHAFWTWGDGYDEAEKVEESYSSPRFIERLLARTHAFLNELLAHDQMAFVETYPFQSPVRNILKMLGTEEDCAEYLGRFAESVACVSPVLVYFDHPDWPGRILRVAAERGPRFESLFFEAFYRSPYGRRHGVTTPAGVIAFYQQYLAVCERLLAKWPHRLVRIDPIAGGQTGTVNRILHAIGMSGPTAASAPNALRPGKP